MWYAIILGLLTSATIISCQAGRYSEHATLLESIGGVLFISGLLLIGGCLEIALSA